MFQLSAEETGSLRSQSGAFKTGRGKHRKYAPYVFTEQGVAMLSSVLDSDRAVQVNIEIMRAFVRLRESDWRLSQIGQYLPTAVVVSGSIVAV